MISLIMPTYNRAATIGRAIRSVLAQTYRDWELVIVDGGSADSTEEVVRSFQDERIRWIQQGQNLGVASGRNRGMDEARADWMGMLDSDDELVPDALAVLMRALQEVDPKLDAISCNCLNAVTRRFTGRGLYRNQYLSVPLSLDRARGEHWGIFRRSLVGSRRFDERIRGYESVFWNRIHEGARWYYLHRGLRIYHTEGQDRASRSRAGDYRQYRAIFDYDGEYLALLRGWSPKAFRRFHWIAAGQFLLAGDTTRFRIALRHLEQGGAHLRPLVLRAGVPLIRLSHALGVLEPTPLPEPLSTDGDRAKEETADDRAASRHH
jgi:glycosyltransferase involved in cell wall biosynthesis